MRTIRFEQREAVGWLWLNRPEKRNAQNAVMVGEILTLLERLVEEEPVRTLVVIGSGPVFSSGLDLEEWENPPPGDHVERLATLPFPTVAALRGAALGGGLELALACDIRLATPETIFGLPEVTLGIIPGWGGTQRLPRLVGPGLAAEMLLTGDPIDAHRAAAAGLVNRLVPDDRLEAEAEAVARLLASPAPLASQYAKEAVYRGLDLPLAHALELEGDLYVLLETTADRQEGIRAFREKRPPRWQHR